MKFNFPNRHSVYLHDTNHRDYFVREYRALSSGCVRIENPLQLSETILKKEDEKKWNKSEIDTIINRKTTRYIPLKNSNINKKTLKMNAPNPIMVATWFGPKPPEVLKLDNVPKTISSKSGVLK